MRARRLVQVVLGLACGLVVTEGAFRLRDHGAFPHLNVYLVDPKLGVRLRPGATERISFSGNPVSSVRINRDGYRGADWLSPSPNEVLVVGDSQAFGLGVEESAHFAAVLEKESGRRVVNAGVPTYGPMEYNAVLEELLSQRRPRTVIWTVNLANDLFEAAHPNRERHAVWDGWAVRRETAPDSVTPFPGRSWLMRDSHAVFALRGLLFRLIADSENGSAASEGSYHDLVSAGAERGAQLRADEKAGNSLREARFARRQQMREELQKVDEQLFQQIYRSGGPLIPSDSELGPGTLHARHANPGDIVRLDYGEGSRPVPATAAQIKTAADLYAQLKTQVRKTGDTKVLSLLARSDGLEESLRKDSTAPFEIPHSRSALWPHLERAKALCDSVGAELVVLVLPLDVQVSQEEWKKYRTGPVDMSASHLLIEDVAQAADELGVKVLDAWPVLGSAEPGAFLDGDLHMSEKGHQAVGHALRQLLSGKGPQGRKRVAPLSLKHSPLPTPAEWSKTPRGGPSEHELPYELKRAGCRMQQAREWLRFDCPEAEVSTVRPGRGDAMAINTPHHASLVLALFEGDRVDVDFRWPSSTAKQPKTGVHLTLEWPLGEGLLTSAVVLDRKVAARPPTENEKRLCACHQKVTGAADCADLYGRADEACQRTYGDDCPQLLRCARGDALAPAICAAEEVQTEASHPCLPAPRPEKSQAPMGPQGP